MKEKLRQHIITRFGKQPPHLEEVLQGFHELEVKKREYLVREGQVCERVYFVVNGCLQIAATDEDGYNNVLGLVFEDNWYTVMDSFQNRTSSRASIMAAEATQLLTLSKSQFDQFKSNIPAFTYVYGQVLEEAYAQFTQRINVLMTMDATERVRWFMDQNPKVLTRLNSNTIANFLKIRPETLSRIKSKIFKP